jgi:hypothetical protein
VSDVRRRRVEPGEHGASHSSESFGILVVGAAAKQSMCRATVAEVANAGLAICEALVTFEHLEQRQLTRCWGRLDDVAHEGRRRPAMT